MGSVSATHHRCMGTVNMGQSARQGQIRPIICLGGWGGESPLMVVSVEATAAVVVAVGYDFDNPYKPH